MNPTDRRAMLPTERSPQAQQIIARLRELNYENPNICEQRIQDAIAQHFKVLNQPDDRPVEIYGSFYAAFDAAWEVMFFDSTWQATINAAWKARCDAGQKVAQEVAREEASAATSDSPEVHSGFVC